MTQHSTNCKMAFGRPTKENGACARCDELKTGATPRKGWSDNKRRFEKQSLQAIRSHKCEISKCGSVCTFGEW